MRNILVVVLWISVMFLGCSVRFSERGSAPAGTFAVRIAANPHDHRHIVDLARGTSNRQVLENGRLIAEWLPVWPHGPAEKDLREEKEIVSRAQGKEHAVLVLYSPSDITEDNMARASYTAATEGRHLVYIELTQRGDECITAITKSNLPIDGVYHRAAMIVNGQVYSLPRIENVVCSRIAISANSEEDAKQLMTILNRRGSK